MNRETNVAEMWQNEALAFSQGPHGDEWEFLNAWTNDPRSTLSEASYRNRLSGVVWSVSLLREHFPNPQARAMEILHQLIARALLSTRRHDNGMVAQVLRGDDGAGPYYYYTDLVYPAHEWASRHESLREAQEAADMKLIKVKHRCSALCSEWMPIST